MDGWTFGLGVLVGMFLASLLIWLMSWIEGARLRRLDQRNAEAMTQIKDHIFHEDLISVPIIESDMAPADTIFVLNPDYLIHDGDRPFIMGSETTMASIRKILEEK